MPSHRFRIGDKVRVVSSSSANAAEAFLDVVTTIDAARMDAMWEVIRQLPADSSGFQYHIRGSQDGSERLVREAQLEPA